MKNITLVSPGGGYPIQQWLDRPGSPSDILGEYQRLSEEAGHPRRRDT